MNFKEKVTKFFKIFHSLEISWQIYSLIILYLLVMILSFIINWRIGLMLLILCLIVIFFFVMNAQNFVRNLNTLANDISKSASMAEQDSLYRAPLAIIIYDNSKRVRWINPEFQNIYQSKDLLGEKLENIDIELIALLEVPDDKKWHVSTLNGYSFRVLHRRDNQSLYLFDVTDEIRIHESRKHDQLVFGYMFLDDYNEVSESMSDEQAAKFDSDLLNDLNQWTSSYGIYSKRLDDERFILILNAKTLKELEKTKFVFFEELHEKNFARNVPISISLGIAYSDSDEYTIKQLEQIAQSNLDLALGRGGDQIVVRSQNERARFYGGKSNPTEKRSNIRARLVYQALKTQIEQADNVLITGHKIPDTDSIGSSIGVQKIASYTGKQAKIIVNPQEFNHDIEELLKLSNAPNWDNILINHEQAEEFINDNTLIIMVDHSRPSLSEGEAYLDGKNIVIIDHHRRSEEFPDNTVLSYIEIYASSTSELVTEFFMNMRNTKKALNKYSATALLAGIIVDTNNFSNRTGSRTFDAASYLKSRGADITQIQSVLKEDFESVVQRNKLLETAKFPYDGYAVAVGDDKKVIDNIIASQAADMMLDIIDVEASFVIYRRNENTIGISARSLNKVNVQTIMERLGGGGHLSNAATQIPDKTIEEAYSLLIKELEYEQGE